MEKLNLDLFFLNSATKKVINHKISLENAFQKILYMIVNYINEGSGWIIELIKFQCINISTYRPLSGSSYMDLPAEVRSPRKGVINIKNRDRKCFLWCHVRHINFSKEHPERILKNYKKIAKNLIIMKLNFL